MQKIHHVVFFLQKKHYTTKHSRLVLHPAGPLGDFRIPVHEDTGADFVFYDLDEYNQYQSNDNISKPLRNYTIMSFECH